MLMPIIRPVQIETKGKNFFVKMYIWLFTIRQWMLCENYILFVNGKWYVVPKGFIFDGASIPRKFWWIISPTGLLFIAAIFHDYGYRYGGFLIFDNDKKENVFIKQSKKEIDEVFLEMNNKINGMKVLNFIAWLGVQLGIFTWWKHRKRNLSYKNLG